MLMNETLKSIMERRSYKGFKGDPIPDDILDTIVEAGRYAPTGMNRQPWHFTVVKSEEGKAMYREAVQSLFKKNAMAGPKPGSGSGQGVIVKPEEEFRGAPVMILVSGDASSVLALSDCVLATENMYIAAASFGIMSGWSHVTVSKLFTDPEVKKQFKIPEGYDVYSASFFGYPDGATKDRGPRKEGTVTVL